MLFIVLTLLLLALAAGPAWWVRRVVRRYSQPADRYPGSGAEFARHLLDALGMQHVKVEAAPAGDHYDPAAKAVRLTPDKHDGRSLTAITVAAHEVGHAMQDRDGYPPLRWRTQMVRAAAYGEKLGAALMFGAPLITLVTRAPGAGLLFLLGGLLSLGSVVIVHLLTLPTEIDASFTRALPMLDGGGYLRPGDLPHARRLLTAAAMTYVAASLMSLLNIGRWLAVLRR